MLWCCGVACLWCVDLIRFELIWFDLFCVAFAALRVALRLYCVVL